MKKFGLLGKEISHTKSPEVYKSLLNNEYFSYELFDYQDETKIDLNEIFTQVNFLNITAPYKEYALKHCGEIVGEARFGINCMKKVKNTLVGFNSDFLALKELLDHYKAGYEKHILLGDGVMAKILLQLNPNFTQFSRRKKNLHLYSEAIVDQKTLVVNACARNFIPDRSVSLVYRLWDLNYSQPYEKTFIANECVDYISGISLLEIQAQHALDFFTQE